METGFVVDFNFKRVGSLAHQDQEDTLTHQLELAGSMSMLVRRNSKLPLLLIGNLTYDVDMMMQDKLPGTGDKKELLKSFSKVCALKENMPDLVILASHDYQAEQLLQSN